ncbi:MAG: hypothetical protein Q9166_008122, partial [cf. Caloplaca sp. 2 TL-2023]
MPVHDIRLLALDGGGVRGLSSLIILEQLMETIDSDSPPKPCDYFDMIGGTSTGGLIAVMLGRLELSIQECIDAYLSLSDRVFEKKRHRMTTKGNIQGRFDSTELERAVKEVVTKQGLDKDALLKAASDDKCKVWVELMPRLHASGSSTCDTVCLTSYKSPRGGSDLLNSVTVWEACRATSAASSFFDPIAIGRYKEEFIDGATGANNPVWQVWDQAQLIWGPEPIEGRMKCLVSIGTGIPSLKPFKDDVFHIGTTLLRIATETEQTAERFRRDKTYLDNTSRYYRFNVAHGLEDIGLEESKKWKEIAAVTRRYVGLQDVLKQMQTCADNIAAESPADSGDYRTIFSLEGVPRVGKFVARPIEMANLERALLPQRHSYRQKTFILHGLGGIGKTQLAVEFARLHYRKFSSVFWLDGKSEDSLKRSFASCASKIPKDQISEASRIYSTSGSSDLDAVVKEVMGWLAHPDNTDWLLIFDNVDREYNPRNPDPDAYDVKRYFSFTDHGSVLITTRLADLEQLGGSQQLGKVDKNQAEAIFRSWYKGTYDEIRQRSRDRDELDSSENEAKEAILDAVYLLGNLYADQGKLVEAEQMYQRALDGKEKVWGPEHTSTLDTVNNLGILYADQGKLVEAEQMYQRALDGKEKAWGPEHTATLDTVNNLGLLYADQGKLVEAEQMLQQALDGKEKVWGPEHTSTLDTVNNLGILYKNQGKLVEAEQMYQRALDGREKAWSPEHMSTLDTVNNLGILYKDQGKLVEAEQ